MSKKISIILACDNHYVVLLAALLKSIEMNHQTEELIDVYLVDDQISKQNKQKLTASLTMEKMNMIWLKMDEIIPEGVTLPLVNNTYPLNTYIRLLIPYFIPKEVNKIIFLDVDMIMLDDISNLWKIDIGDKVIGAVNDTVGPQAKTIAEGIENYQELGLDPNEKYFNAGMQLINIDRWRAQDITQKTFDAINNNKKYAALGDQYGLNIALVGNWYEIDRMWNCFSVCTDPHPKLIHYFHRKPIYKTYAYNYKKEFFYYLNKTKFSDFQPIGETTRYLKKINNMLEKIKLFFK
ncbi:glycosyltransferase family 8 protein [Pedobacter gandavensis]|uniref:Glycosyltransferase family 8 protein n=1 Tax=Pedobacter gandavensis TaxID=2679963 RepID=A0ABR6ET24_9SPHI|nr:glycosyltransferase family 8 protein [Pedobacter gandavensis]MBB2148415.1 glycosyltransferase family 8 protein [Pedobacter gandavensis]